MHPASSPEPERLTDGSTYYWSRIFPTVWSGLVGIVVALLWLDVLGDGPIPLAVKVTATTLWAVLSAFFFRAFGRFQDVWLDGDDLLVGDPIRGLRISLRDVREVKESRLNQVKNIKLKLARPTPWGDSIAFVPKGFRTFLFPYASSPVADDLRERRRQLLPQQGTRAPE
ncbi:MAG: hypothetical protein Q8N53_07585 [Longimicrobiales bacterium]|nr:hypothetical protein [Longimicrobiales bacterium]